jgi:hypothetical protein
METIAKKKGKVGGLVLLVLFVPTMPIDFGR